MSITSFLVIETCAVAHLLLAAVVIMTKRARRQKREMLQSYENRVRNICNEYEKELSKIVESLKNIEQNINQE